MTVSQDRVEDELGRPRIVFYVPEDAHSGEWIDAAAEDAVLTSEKR